MKGILKKLVLRRLLILFVCLISIYNVSAKNKVSALFEQNKHIVDELDYYSSKEVNLNLPNGKQLSLNWGDIGHGDILQPFNGIKPQLRDIEVLSDIDDEDEFGAIGIGKRIAKAVLKKQIKKVAGRSLDDFLDKLPPFIRWIVEKIVKNGKLSPIEEFVLRSYILYQTPFDEDKQALKTAEFTALLFKLALTEGQDILDVKNDLGSYLVNSEMINELLGQNFVDFVTDILSSLQNGFQDCDFDSLDIVAGQAVPVQSDNYKVGYVFKELNLAMQCFALFDNKEYSEKEFKKIVNSFVQNLSVDSQDIWLPRNYEIIPLDNFRGYQNSTLNNFVGLVDDVDQVLEFIPEASNVVESVCTDRSISSNVQLIPAPDVSIKNEYWVVLKTQDKGSNLDLSKTVKFTCAAIYKTFQDYNLIKIVTTDGFSSGSPMTTLSDGEVRESKLRLENLLNAKRYFQKELTTLDLEIEEIKTKLDSSNNNFWNKFFSNMDEEKLQDLLEKRKRKEIQLSNIETEIRKLSVGLYYLTAPERLQDLSDKGVFAIITDMFLSNPRVEEFVKDINQDSKYKSVKENLIKRLAKVFGQSDYVKEYWEVAEYILSNLLPDYKNDFRNFAQNLKEQDDDDIGDLVLSFIGL